MSLAAADTTTAPAPQPPESSPPQLPRTAAYAAGAAAVIAAATLSWHRPGVGWSLTALAAVAAVAVAARRSLTGWSPRGMARVGWAAAAVALTAVGAVRAAGWLFVLCLLTAAVAGCVALTDRSSALGVLLAPLRVAAGVPAAWQWLGRCALRTRGSDRSTIGRTLVAAAVTAVLVAVFGLLLVNADAVFAHVLSTVVRALSPATLSRWAASAALTATLVAVAARALLDGGKATGGKAAEGTVPARRLRHIEWALPVGAISLLFAGFIGVQATVLFGGGDHVLATAGLTYATYARGGFWQLLVLTGLTVTVVAAAAQVAPRTSTGDRVLLRGLLGLLSALTLVIVASALSRMAAYEQAYGFTRLRLLVTACEVWLGVVLLLILGAGIRLRGRWVPQAALAAAVAALLGLAVLNPDAFIARENIARFHADSRIDLDYLGTLSSDAVPALETLPEPYRSCALRAIRDKLAAGGDPAWYEWNLGRAVAEARLRADPPAVRSSCLWGTRTRSS